MMQLTPDADIQLTLDIPQRFTVVSCKLDEGISRLTHAKVEIASNDYLDLDQVLEKDGVLHIAPEGFAERRWTLRVGHIDFARIVDGSMRYVVNLYPEMWLLGLTTNTRKFRNLSAQDIVSTMLTEREIEHRFELTRPTDKRKYCVQYREKNLDFVLRLMEFEGIHYSFDDDGTVVFADSSRESPKVDGPPAYELVTAAGALQWKTPGIHAFRTGRRVASGTATVNDHNWKKPQMSLLGSRSAGEDDDLEIYDYPVGYRRVDQGERLAQLRLEAQRVAARYVGGSSNVTSFAPARVFAFAAPDSRFAGDYLITSVSHDYVNRKFERTLDGAEEGITYRNHFEAIPKDVPFRPPLTRSQPHLSGCHTAMVRGPEGEEIHTDTYGRMKAQFHWDREATGSDEDSRWLRALQETQTGTTLARVGWEMSVSYINGDPDRPIGVARKINGVMRPEYGQPDNKTRMTVKTPSYPDQGGFNELRLEDLAAAMHFDWHAEKDFVGAVVRDKTEKVGNDETVNVAEAYSHSVQHDETVSIAGDYKAEVGAIHRCRVTNDRKDTVGGNETRRVSAVCSMQVSGNDQEKVTGDRKTTIKEDGGIERSITEELKREVGGTWLAQGDGNFTAMVQGKLVETVTADKQTIAAKGNIVSKVTGKLDHTIGGSSIRMCPKDQGYSGKCSQIEVNGSASMLAGERIEISGDKVVLEASAQLSFKSGELELTLTPGSVTIKGKMNVEAETAVSVTSPNYNITK
jgi:type VI secretion system secreted protein VgrG